MSGGRTSAPREGTRRRRLGVLVRALLSTAFVALLAWRVDVGEAVAIVRSLRAAPLLWALLATAGTVLAHTWRWRALLASRGIGLAWGDALRAVLAGQFLNLFLPTNIGGDAFRAYATRRAAASLLQSAGIVVAERAIGLLATFLVALVALAGSDYARRQPLLAALVVTLAAGFVAVLAAGASRRVVGGVAGLLQRLRLVHAAQLLARIGPAMRGVARSPRLLATTLALSVAMKLLAAASLVFLALALGLRLSWVAVFVFLPLHTLVAALPISIGGIGPREATLVAFFAVHGLSAEEAAGLALLHLVWIFLVGLPGALFVDDAAPAEPT